MILSIEKAQLVRAGLKAKGWKHGGLAKKIDRGERWVSKLLSCRESVEEEGVRLVEQVLGMPVGTLLGTTQSGGVVEEMFTVLDLRSWRKAGVEAEEVAHVTTRYSFSQLPLSGCVRLTPGTTGSRIAADCLSHPGCFDWREALPVQPTPDVQHLAHQYLMEISPPSSELGKATAIEVQFDYFNAFQNPTCEWMHYHISWPTKTFVFVIVFPPAKRARSAVGWHQDEVLTHNKVQAPQQPSLLDGGQYLTWSVSPAKVGDVYEARWQW